jgi:succinate-semialdehyde dehydrogenase/glutarate-semialdehyde dehydrogenase
MARAQREERITMTDAAGPVRMFIAGGWTAAASGATSMATSPATGESLGPVPEGDREDARRALDAAALAFPSWSGASPFDRGRLLHRIGEVCDRRKDELARMLTLDQGKPLRAEAYEEVHELIAFWHLAAEDAVRLEGVIPASSSSD